MENNDGIQGKSPDYVLEKFIRYVEQSSGKEHKWGLDAPNRQKLKAYYDRWFNPGADNNEQQTTTDSTDTPSL